MARNVMISTESRRKVVERYLQPLLDLVNIDGETGGASITWNAPARNYFRLVAGNIEFPTLPFRSDHEHYVLRAAGRLKASKAAYGVEDLLDALEAEIRDLRPKIAKATTILLPLNVELPEGALANITLLGVSFERVLWGDVSANLKLADFHAAYTRQLGLEKPFPLATHFTPFLVRAAVDDPRAAGIRALRAFHLLRAALNWQFQFGRLVRRLGSNYPAPRAAIAAPPVYGIFDETGSFETLFFNSPRLDNFRRNEVEGDRVAAAVVVLNGLESEPERGQTQYLVSDAFLRYGDALDAMEPRLAFLSLWQILETLALQDNEGVNMKTVVSRISLFFSRKEMLRDLLMTCYDTRNDLVHRGVFVDDFADEEIGHLKSIAEGALASILDLRADFPTRTALETFYELSTVTNATLEQRESAISAIRKRRSS